MLFTLIGVPLVAIAVLAVWFIIWGYSISRESANEKKIHNLSSAIKVFFAENFGWIGACGKIIFRAICRLGKAIVWLVRAIISGIKVGGKFVFRTIRCLGKAIISLVRAIISGSLKKLAAACQKIIQALKKPQGKSKPAPETADLSAGKLVESLIHDVDKETEDNVKIFERIGAAIGLRKDLGGSPEAKKSHEELVISEVRVRISTNYNEAAAIDQDTLELRKKWLKDKAALLSQEEEVRNGYARLMLGTAELGKQIAKSGQTAVKEIISDVPIEAMAR